TIPGDQDDLALERAADLVLFQVHGGTAEEVFDGDVADLRGEPIGCDDFRETGDGLIGNAGSAATLEDLRHLRAAGRRQSDEDGFDGLRSDDRGQRGAIAEDSHTMNEIAGLGRLIVDEAYDLIRQRGILVD